jgi:hypothetical protein
MFILKFKIDNSAFSEGKDIETVRILKTIINKIENGYYNGKVIDINGNKIGEYSLK